MLIRVPLTPLTKEIANSKCKQLNSLHFLVKRRKCTYNHQIMNFYFYIKIHFKPRALQSLNSVFISNFK